MVTQPELFVVNIGDLLMRWTNDRWISNPHRVANPEPGPARDIVVLNAAAGLLAAGRSSAPPQAAQLAAEAIDLGAAANLLERLAQLSHEPVS